MAKSFTLQLDHDGIRKLLKSQDMADMVNDAAADIIEKTKTNLPEGVEVGAQSYVTDRAAASVAIEDVQGMLYQARDGALTKAAQSIGAEVKGKK